MIARSNLPSLRERVSGSACVLDVGGWYQPFNLATHVIDLFPYESRRVHDALDPSDVERFSAATWVVRDVCDAPWPFPDITRNDIGRKLSEQEGALALFWAGEFTFEEVFTDIQNDYSSFRH